jgi:hypothetical protein
MSFDNERFETNLPGPLAPAPAFADPPEDPAETDPDVAGLGALEEVDPEGLGPLVDDAAGAAPLPLVPVAELDGATAVALPPDGTGTAAPPAPPWYTDGPGGTNWL